jgi:hypothetical protein
VPRNRVGRLLMVSAITGPYVPVPRGPHRGMLYPD